MKEITPAETASVSGGGTATKPGDEPLDPGAQAPPPGTIDVDHAPVEGPH